MGVLLAGALALPAVAAAAAKDPKAEASYRKLGFRWSGHRIPYYNGAKGIAKELGLAVKAWNRSGARVRFVAVPRKRARVLVRYNPGKGCVPGGFSTPRWFRGRATNATVYLSRRIASDAGCSRWAITLTAAHELGHVLGLAHESRGCALMDGRPWLFAPTRCPKMKDWQWRCRLLERDDVRGAVRLYGGRVKKRPKAVCDMYGAPKAPGAPSASFDETGGATLSFTRPGSARPPAFFPAFSGFKAAIKRDTCPALGEATAASDWSVAVGGRESVPLFAGQPGRFCLRAWSTDAQGRVSRAATVFADYAPPPPPPDEGSDGGP